jgi:uncharacterized membrane protein YfcA
MPEYFIDLSFAAAIQIIVLGFIGGVLSGFIGSGGAFFMTPGMMNLGVPGPVSVASNITHKFGKAMMGSRKHGEMGNVDRKLGIFLIITAVAGIQLAAWIMGRLFEEGGDSHGAVQGAGANLYISLVFVLILSLVGLSMLRDAMRATKDEAGPSKKITRFLSGLRLSPFVYFPVSDVKVSLWILLAVGLATGYLAGTIGVGGFIGVPAMIYVFGIPTAVAAGTELYLAMFMGATGALTYAFKGLVDLRLTMLLYLGSLVGIYIGVYGTKVVREVMIRYVTGVIILICVVSRAIPIPMYLRQLGYLEMNPAWDVYFNVVSKVFLFLAGFIGCGIILWNVVKAYRQRSRVRASLLAARAQ